MNEQKMTLFDVYPLFDITPVKGKGCYIWDDEGQKYLDLYGGHAVISIGHSQPHYVSVISQQLKKNWFLQQLCCESFTGGARREAW